MRANFDSLKLAVEGMSGGKNTVLFDDMDMPSIMVRIPQMKFSDLITGGTQDVHDAFICNEVTYESLYIGKYLSTVVGGRAYSLAGKDPAVNMDFDTARAYCRAKGAGWHLPTNALYAAIALWCKANKTLPHGNTNYGADHANPYERGFASCSRDSNGKVQRTATGSGPDTWYHDYNAATGIADLCGNVWEWAGGLRLVDGEIQVIPYGNAMADIYSGASDIQGASSTLWKALDKDGNFVAPGSAGTLRYDYVADPGTSGGGKDFQLVSGALAHKQTVEAPYADKAFWSVAAKSGLTVPVRAKALGLMPDGDAAAYGNRGHLWMRNLGERLPIRGGDWLIGADAGVPTLNLYHPRTDSYGDLGFRSAFFGNL